MADKEISAVLRIEGGTADKGLLDIYDAASTIYGIARALNIVSHAFGNDEQVRKRADAAKGSQVFIHSSKKGCFEEQIDILFDENTVDKFGHSVITNNFWDYLTWSWAAAVGKAHPPSTPYLKKLAEKDPEFVHVIADALETPMQELHKSIESNPRIKIYLNRPRMGDVLTFDARTWKYVTVREEDKERIHIDGNVTKFNVLSDFGRLYSDNDGKTISFRLAESKAKFKKLALDSMKSVVDETDEKLTFYVSRVLNAEGFVKRYIVHDIEIKQGD